MLLQNNINAKISILGCGWLGEPLAQHLIKLKYQVKGSTTSENKIPELNSVGIRSYLIKIELLSSDISEFLDSEILIISIPSKNNEGFKNLINSIKISKIKKVVFISSTSVYDNSKEIITEQSLLKPSSLAEIEQMFKTNSRFSTTIVRFGGLFGYDRNPGKFFPGKKKIENPNGFVNMIHRDDCIRIIEQIINKNIWDETLNACADSHPTRREFYSKAALDAGIELPDFDEDDSAGHKIISNQKLKTILEYDFKYPDLLNIVEKNIDDNLKMK